MSRSSYRTGLAAAMIAAGLGAAAMGWPSAARAQVVVLVNGDPITNLDIEQRSRLIQISTHKSPTRQEVIDELINERLEIKEAKKYTLEASDRDVDNAYANMAGRMHISAAQLTELLAKEGIRADTLKMRIRAELVWTQLVKGRYQSSLEIGEKDVLGAMASDKPGDKDAVGYEFALRPILLIVPRGASPAVFEERKKEAEALRARFQNCEEGLNFAKALRDSAVRETVIKNVADVPEQLRGVLEGTAVGHLTPPEITKDGVETFAICSKRQTKNDTPEKRAAKEKLFASRYQAKAQQYLQEVRRSAMIEYR